MSVVERDMALIEFVTEPDGAALRVRVRFSSGSGSTSTTAYTFVGEPARAGEWLHGFHTAVGSLRFAAPVKVRMVNGAITGFRHVTEPRPWFDPRPEQERQRASAHDRRVDRAAKFINHTRVGVQAPLERRPGGGWASRTWPDQVWTDDEVVAYAQEKGWSG